MSIASLIERIAGKQRERQAARAADFRSLVARIADGQEPDADTVDRVLQDAGKSLDELRQAVERLHHRRQLREQLDRLPALASERQEIEKQIAAADAALEAAEKKHSETTGPLVARLQQIRELVAAAEAAKRQLADTCTDDALLAEHRQVQAEVSKAYHEAAECREAASRQRERARSERAAAERAKRIVGGDDQVEEHLARAQQHEQRAAEFDAEVAKVEKRIARLQRDAAEVRERMLVP